VCVQTLEAAAKIVLPGGFLYAPPSPPSRLVELSEQLFSAPMARSAPSSVIAVEVRCNGDEQQETAPLVVVGLQGRVATAFHYWEGKGQRSLLLRFSEVIHNMALVFSL